MSFISGIIFYGGWFLWVYTFAVILFEMVIGSQAAHLLVTQSEAMAELQSLAIPFLLLGSISLVWLILSLIWFFRLQCEAKECFDTPCSPMCWSESPVLDAGPFFANSLSTGIGLILGAYMTWKLHHQDYPAEIALVLFECQILLIVTTPMVIIWLGLILFVEFSNRFL